MSHIMISYTTADLACAQQLYDTLRRHGIEAWFAPVSIPIGSSYPDEIVRAIQTGDGVALLLSEASQASPDVQREVGLAVHFHKPLYPLLLEEVDLNDKFVYWLSLAQFRRVRRLDEQEPEIVDLLAQLRPTESRQSVLKEASAAKSAPVYRMEGERVLFGLYPQSKVTDEAVIADLNAMAVDKPTAANPGLWTPFPYHVISWTPDEDIMWYIDLPYKGKRYRGISFERYRSDLTNGRSSEGYQMKNDYRAHRPYWFVYEPIRWRILTQEEDRALLMSEMVLDAQAYADTLSGFVRVEDGVQQFENNYANSLLRGWLNDTFAGVAFGKAERRSLIADTVGNGDDDSTPTGAAVTSNPYLCEDTTDAVFAPSLRQITDPSAGFAARLDRPDAKKQKRTTDYARCQGANTCTDSAVRGMGTWWLRTPLSTDSADAYRVNADGSVSGDIVRRCAVGVVPCVWLRLK